MKERDDDQLRGVAMAAFDSFERSVTADDTEQALARVRDRIAAGGAESVTPAPVDELSARRDRRASAWMIGAAASVVALLIGGLVVVNGRSDDATTSVGGSLPPAPSAPSTAVPSVATSTVATTTDDAADSTVSTVPSVSTTVVPVTSPSPAATAGPPVEVDASDPPQLLDPAPIAAVPLEPNDDGNRVDVSIGPDSIVVAQFGTGFVSVVDPAGDGSVQRVDIATDISPIVSGPSGVIYGIGGPVFDDDNDAAPRGFRFPAIAITGDRAGEVVAEAEVGLNDFLETPAYPLGNGPDGIVDRGRQQNKTIIGHVDDQGDALDPAAEFPVVEFARSSRGVRSSVIEISTTDTAWTLHIDEDPNSGDTYVGPTAPVPSSDGRVVYAERIGENLTPDSDFGSNAMPVVAVLQSDGSGEWFRLPDDWDVVASDIWGTVLARVTDDVIELALLDDALAATDAPTSADPARLTIPRNCVDDNVCTHLESTADGRIVAFDPTDNTLRTYNALGDELLAEAPVDQEFPDPYPDSEIGALPLIEHVGPDDVVYLSYYAVDGGDAMRDLIAVPLGGPSAGSVIQRWEGLDGSGDSDLVPTRSGLAVVGCCGPEPTRPSPDATVFGYVDRNGSPIESDGPVFRVDLGDAGNELARIDVSGDETRFRLPTVASFPRGMPRLAATDDGGAVMDIYSVEYNQSFVVDVNTDWPQFGIDPADVHLLDDGVGISLLEPAGTVVVADGDGFVRRSLDEVGTAGWPGNTEVDIDTGTTSAPGLNDHIAANQPSWAADPTLLGLQLSPWAGPNERVDIQFDEGASTLTITTSGLLDDSTESTQQVIRLERDADDGLWRFVSGTYGWRCQPGRGHQDYSIEFCN